MSLLNTTNPIALRALMSETIFGIEPLISVVTLEEPVLEAQPAKAEFMGANKKNILFITESINNEYFTQDAELAFIKMLGALKLDLQDVAVVNCADETSKRSFDSLNDQFAPRICVFLGVDPQKLGLGNFASNILWQEREVEFLYSFSFEEMLTETAKKKMFWETIKLMDF